MDSSKLYLAIAIVAIALLVVQLLITATKAPVGKVTQVPEFAEGEHETDFYIEGTNGWQDSILENIEIESNIVMIQEGQQNGRITLPVYNLPQDAYASTWIGFRIKLDVPEGAQVVLKVRGSDTQFNQESSSPSFRVIRTIGATDGPAEINIHRLFTEKYMQLQITLKKGSSQLSPRIALLASAYAYQMDQPCYDNDIDGYDAAECGGSDCNDNNSEINPGAEEICLDGIDNDCSNGDNTCPLCGEQISARCLCGQQVYDSGYCCEEVWQATQCVTEPVCGNGICEQGENYQTCPQDCEEPGEGCPDPKPAGMISCETFEGPGVIVGEPVPEMNPAGDGEVSRAARTFWGRSLPNADGMYIDQGCNPGKCPMAYVSSEYPGETYAEPKFRYDDMIGGSRQVYMKFDVRIDPDLGTNNENREMNNFKFSKITEDLTAATDTLGWGATLNFEPNDASYSWYGWSDGSCQTEYYTSRATVKLPNHIMDNQWHTYEVFVDIGENVVTSSDDPNADGIVRIWEDGVLILEDTSVPMRCSAGEGSEINSVSFIRHAKNLGMDWPMEGHMYFDNLEVWDRMPGTSEPVCGDGLCEPGEDYINCPQDCQPPSGELEILSVSGSILDGSTITINGVGFGQHPDYNVMGTEYLNSFWDDFDDYANLAEMDVNWQWSNENFALDTNIARGTQSIRLKPNTSSSKIRQGADVYDENGVWYTSFWLYLPDDYSQLETQQWKVVRIFDGTNNPDYLISMPCAWDEDLQLCKVNLGHNSDDDCKSQGDPTYNCYGVTTPFFYAGTDTVQGSSFLGRWHRFEALVNSDNDELMWYIDGHKWYDCNELYGSDCIPDDFDKNGFRFASIDEVRHASPGNYGYQDDYYISNTWARIEISPENRFTVGGDERLLKNIQIPTFWSNNQLQAELNLEGMSGTVYVFVVNADGELSNGYPITIGS